ncbi:hypothetical protein JYG40_23510, partial [Escherichia fergusonii]|nr:hypothetical protein [Escherichia fergusonii]
LASLLALGAGPGAALAQVAANATPQGGKLVAGQANWQQSGTSLTVNQGSSRAAIDWTSFDIGRNASVVFRQPDAN